MEWLLNSHDVVGQSLPDTLSEDLVCFLLALKLEDVLTDELKEGVWSGVELLWSGRSVDSELVKKVKSFLVSQIRNLEK